MQNPPIWGHHFSSKRFTLFKVTEKILPEREASVSEPREAKLEHAAPGRGRKPGTDQTDFQSRTCPEPSRTHERAFEGVIGIVTRRKERRRQRAFPGGCRGAGGRLRIARFSETDLQITNTYCTTCFAADEFRENLLIFLLRNSHILCFSRHFARRSFALNSASQRQVWL